jgi:integrase
MGTITPRTSAAGKTTYKAQVRIRRGGVIIHQETQTFDRRTVALAWTKKRETELAKPGALEIIKSDDPPLSQVIRQYVDESQKNLTHNKKTSLLYLAKQELTKLKCSEITSNVLVQFGRALDVEPVTTSSYFSHLKGVFKVAKPAWGYPLDKAAFVEALDVLSEMGITGTSNHRERRPTLDELGKVLAHLRTKRMENPDVFAYDLIVLFAIFSTRRRSEILRMRWSDIDEAESRLMVFDMKDPKKKIGNNVWVDLTPEAVRIARAVPRIDDVLVFPYSPSAVSDEFKKACEAEGVEDLRFHDMRHEGVSRLFELGKDIPAVSMMSGHKTWTHLKRYAHIQKYGDKYADWEWLDIVAPLPQPPLGYRMPHS